MKEKNYTGAVPKNYQGESITAESAREFEDTAAAKAFFREAGRQLMDVNHWHDWAGKTLGRFLVSDHSGNPVDGLAEKGLLLKIDIPGPGSKSGGGYDWVRIEEIVRVDSPDIESIAMRVRPTSAPESDDKETAHFYDNQSTSTFTLTREYQRITAAVYDRNIVPNTVAVRFIDKLRNAVMGFAGKKVFSQMQWQSLVDKLLQH